MAVLCPALSLVPQAVFYLATALCHFLLGKQNAACGIPEKGPGWGKEFRALPLGLLCGLFAHPEA